MNAGENTLFELIHDYLKIYMPKQRNFSSHTVNSYRKSLELLVDFVKAEKRIPLHDVTFEMMTPEIVTAFLDSLEADRGCSISTRNIRLAAIRSFVKYAANRDIALIAIQKGIKTVAVKKPDKVEVISHMSMAAISSIVDQTDVSKRLGLRNRTLLILLYDTGARIQEVVKARLCDLRFGRTPTITLHGKGNKIRTVPVMEITVQHLQKHIEEFHANVPLSSDRPIFYAITHGELHALSDRRVRYLLNDYAEKARESCLEVPEKVSPHTFRHSRSLHLYQNGMDLTLVSQWLGHAKLETTQLFYARADTEHKRNAIATATFSDNPLRAKMDPERFTISDEETLKRLAGLK
jgi:site-specific recombinase XerD